MLPQQSNNSTTASKHVKQKNKQQQPQQEQQGQHHHSPSSLRSLREPYLAKHHKFVCRVCLPSLKPSARKHLISKASNHEIYALCECIRNVVCRSCPISKETLRQLARFQRPLTSLSQDKRKLKVAQRKKILVQRGSGIFLPLIASAVMSYLLR